MNFIVIPILIHVTKLWYIEFSCRSCTWLTTVSVAKQLSIGIKCVRPMVWSLMESGQRLKSWHLLLPVHHLWPRVGLVSWCQYHVTRWGIMFIYSLVNCTAVCWHFKPCLSLDQYKSSDTVVYKCSYRLLRNDINPVVSPSLTQVDSHLTNGLLYCTILVNPGNLNSELPNFRFIVRIVNTYQVNASIYNIKHIAVKTYTHVTW